MADHISVPESFKSKVIPFETADEEIQKLARLSVSARENSYCIYSKFPVGAALICEDGKIYQGCNVENASYGLTICAEQTAISKAISEGSSKVTAIAVCADVGLPVPCGKCRQVIFECGKDIPIYCVQPNLKEIFLTSIGELLPLAFAFQ